MSVANIYTFCGYPVAALLMSLNRQVLSSEESSKNIQSNMYETTFEMQNLYKGSNFYYLRLQKQKKVHSQRQKDRNRAVLISSYFSANRL